MKKKSIVLIATAVMLMAAMVVGGTLAYFTDKDAETNTFTTGDVKIDLTENFDQDSKLMPTTGKDKDGNIKNAVEKEVFVESTGSEDAYVRVHIAIPQILDNGDPDFDASANVLHFNYAPESIGADKWDWSKAADDDKYEGNWNFYTAEIDGIWYNVYVVTYGAPLSTGDKTVDAMHQVYLDSKVTNEDIVKINEALGESWKILVAAEGAQVAGFDNAYDALNAAFGIPGEYTVDWTAVKNVEQ